MLAHGVVHLIAREGVLRTGPKERRAWKRERVLLTLSPHLRVGDDEQSLGMGCVPFVLDRGSTQPVVGRLEGLLCELQAYPARRARLEQEEVRCRLECMRLAHREGRHDVLDQLTKGLRDL